MTIWQKLHCWSAEAIQHYECNVQNTDCHVEIQNDVVVLLWFSVSPMHPVQIDTSQNTNFRTNPVVVHKQTTNCEHTHKHDWISLFFEKHDDELLSCWQNISVQPDFQSSEQTDRHDWRSILMMFSKKTECCTYLHSSLSSTHSTRAIRRPWWCQLSAQHTNFVSMTPENWISFGSRSDRTNNQWRTPPNTEHTTKQTSTM